MTDQDLPLPDYDHLQGGALASRIRTLDASGVQTLLDYERSHANRVQVVTMMEHRLGALREGAQPSGGDPEAPVLDNAGPGATGSKVSGATSGPANNPPSHGDPTNPAQPRGKGGSGPGGPTSPIGVQGT
jgi:hypothetical protein